MSDFTLPEKQVAGSILPGRQMLEQVQAYRRQELTRGLDYEIVAGKCLYTQAAYSAMLASLSGAGAAPDGPPSQPEKKRAAPADAVVTRVFPQNPRFMLARMGTTDITVRIRETRNFCAGMTLEAAFLVPTGGPTWDWIGRLPKARGTW